MTATLLTQLIVQPDKLEKALGYMRAMRNDVKKNESFVQFYEFYQLKERPNEIWVVEVFDDDAGIEAHLKRAEYRVPEYAEFLVEFTINRTINICE
jgi:quinol monooxygenase YgiN